MELLIQKHLRSDTSGDVFGRLQTEHNIKARFHKDYPNLVLLKYGIDADFMNPMVRECRGIILDLDDNLAVVSRAFDKFGNHGEPYAAEIDWSTARVQEKLDGSLCVLYHYDDKWHVATSGSPDASGNVQQAGLHTSGALAVETFAEYFWSTFEAQGGRLLDKAFDELCFAFELTGPLNRVVVAHTAPQVQLLSVRNRVTSLQMAPEPWAHVINIPAVRTFDFHFIVELLASFDDISPVEQEGYVVVDGDFNRIKIKHPGYVALHHAKDGLGPKAFLEIARTGETAEVLTAFPELQPALDQAKESYQDLIDRVESAYSRVASIDSQKDFAAEAMKTPWSACLFQMRKGRDLREFLREIQIDKLMNWMAA
jgi:hypothetical protein